MSADIQSAIQAIAQAAFSLVLVLVPILIKLLYPIVRDWLLAKLSQAKGQLTAQEFELIQVAAMWAVSTVEQLKKKGEIPTPEAAAARAGHIAQQWLQSRGILVDMAELEAAIESAVHELPKPVERVR